MNLCTDQKTSSQISRNALQTGASSRQQGALLRSRSPDSRRHLPIHTLAAHFVLTFLLLAVSPCFHPLHLVIPATPIQSGLLLILFRQNLCVCRKVQVKIDQNATPLLTPHYRKQRVNCAFFRPDRRTANYLSGSC